MFCQAREDPPLDGLRIKDDAEDYPGDKQTEQRVQQYESALIPMN
jgi:hypothetical protein